MSFVVGRGQGFAQNLAVLIGLTGWVKAGHVAGGSGAGGGLEKLGAGGCGWGG